MTIYTIVNNVELGVKLNEEEVVAIGSGLADFLSDPDSVHEFLETMNKIAESTKQQKAAEDPDPEEDEDEEEDTDYEKERDRLIKELRDLGCEVHKVNETEDDGLIECSTYDHGLYGSAKFKFVKSWLKTGNIEFKEEKTCGDPRITYKLTGSDLAALQQYLKDNEVIGSNVVL